MLGRFLIRFCACAANGIYIETNGKNKTRISAIIARVKDNHLLSFNLDSIILAIFLMKSEIIIERKVIRIISLTKAKI